MRFTRQIEVVDHSNVGIAFSLFWRIEISMGPHTGSCQSVFEVPQTDGPASVAMTNGEGCLHLRTVYFVWIWLIASRLLAFTYHLFCLVDTLYNLKELAVARTRIDNRHHDTTRELPSGVSQCVLCCSIRRGVFCMVTQAQNTPQALSSWPLGSNHTIHRECS